MVRSGVIRIDQTNNGFWSPNRSWRAGAHWKRAKEKALTVVFRNVLAIKPR